MKKKFVAFIALLLLLTIHGTASADNEVRRWKSMQDFELNLDGYQDSATAGQNISFYVQPLGPSDVDVTPEEGFDVQASLTDNARNKTVATALGRYDPDKRAWLVSLQTPGTPGDDFQVHVYFGCGVEGTPCDDLYGRAARATKDAPLQLR